MRKALLYSIAAAVLLASLVGCSKDQQAAATPATEQVETTTVPEQTESQDTTETPDTEQPDSTATPEANQLSSTETPETETAVEMTEDELHSIFETMYLASMHSIKGTPYIALDKLLPKELDSIKNHCEALNKQLPSNYAEQYETWRENYKITDMSYVFFELTKIEFREMRTAFVLYSDIYRTTEIGFVKSGDLVLVCGKGYDKALGWIKVIFDGVEGYICEQDTGNNSELGNPTEDPDDTGVTDDTLGSGHPDEMINDGENYYGLGEGGQMGEAVDLTDPFIQKYGMTPDEVAQLPDDQKIALGFTYDPDLGWRDSTGRSLPVTITEEEKAITDELNKGVTFGGG